MGGKYGDRRDVHQFLVIPVATKNRGMSRLSPDSSPAGRLYGTTTYGGTYVNEHNGVVFKLRRGTKGSWTETLLHTFQYTDGGYPVAGTCTVRPRTVETARLA